MSAFERSGGNHETAKRPVGLRTLLLLRLVTSSAFYSVFPWLVIFLTSVKTLSSAQAILFVGASTFLGRLVGYLIARLGHRLDWAHVARVAGVIAVLASASGFVFHDTAILAVGSICLLGAANTVITIALRSGVVVTERNYPLAFGNLGVANNLGIIIGPLIAGLCVSRLGVETLFPVSGVQYLIALAVIYFARSGNNIETSAATLRTTAASIEPFPNRCLLVLFFLSNALIWATLYQLVMLLAPYAEAVTGSSGYASVFFITQSTTVIVLAPICGRMLSGKDIHILMRFFFIGAALLPISLLCLSSLALSPLLILVLIALIVTLSEALAVPSGGAILLRLVKSDRVGGMFGVLSLAEGAGLLLSTLVAAWSAERIDAIFWRSSGVGILSASVFLGVWALSIKVRTPAPAGTGDRA